VFAYEHGSPVKVTDKRRDKLMENIACEEFQPVPLERRIVFNDLEDFVRDHALDTGRAEDAERLKQQFASECLDAEIALAELAQFCLVQPRLPEPDEKTFTRPDEPLALEPGMSRNEIVERLDAVRGRNAMAAMAFYAYRDLNRTEPGPFLLAAVQRNPVSIEGAADLSDDEVAGKIRAMPDASIYDEAGRLAQPDEVWNYGRGDGVERALTVANIRRARHPDEPLRIAVEGDRAVLRTGSTESTWSSQKQLADQVWELP
jgi:hypothetical protein